MPAKDILFELLRNNSIQSILDGDVDFGDLGTIETTGFVGNIKQNYMPYLGGPTLKRHFQ